MPSIWVEGLGRSFEHSLDLMAAAVHACPDELWEKPMWQVAAPAFDHQFLGSDWKPVTGAAERRHLVAQWVLRWAAPWSVAWHALEVLDYDLHAGSGPWTPPPPFAGHPHWRDLPLLAAAWPQPEILRYIEYCRQRVRDTLADMTGEKAATPLPAVHRYSGRPYAWLITDLLRHTTEHGAQIRQFIAPGASA